MGDRPPGGPPAAPIPPPDPNPAQNPLTQRTFFSSVAAGDFFEQLQVVLDRQHAQTLQAQEMLVTRMNAPVVALTGLIERLLATMPIPQQPPASNPTSPTPSIRQSPPPVPERPSSVRPSEEPPVNPYRSPYRDPPPPRGPPPPVLPPVRETTAFTFATAETAASAFGSGGISGIKLPMFSGEDGENVVA